MICIDCSKEQRSRAKNGKKAAETSAVGGSF